jgi:hypothetical protein
LIPRIIQRELRPEKILPTEDGYDQEIISNFLATAPLCSQHRQLRDYRTSIFPA